MEIPRKAWQEYIGKLSKINKKAAQLMSNWIAENGYNDINAMIDVANSLTQKYGEAASSLACEMYESIAEASGVSVPAAIPADVMPSGYVANAVKQTVDVAPTTVSSLVERIVKQASADTILQNAKRDGAEFAWIPSGDTCAFCLTLASNGWQHISKKTLRNGHAEHIHSNCDCQYAVRFSDDGGVAGYRPQEYAEMYYNADGARPNDKINAMRRENYAKNRDKILEQKRIAYKLRTERNDNST